MMAAVGDETVADGEALHSNKGDEPIATMAIGCESNFSESLRLMESNKEEKHAQILRKLQAKFSDWAAYLGVFAGRDSSLDQRLSRHLQYRDLVLLALDMLNMNLIQSKFDMPMFHGFWLTEC